MALVLLVALEVAARRYFTPGYVSPETYLKYYPAYDYGFSGTPVCWPIDEEYRCLETPYQNIIPQSFPVVKPRRESRIFVFGSSVSHGHGTSYSTILESELNKRRRGHRVINLSANSTGSARQLIRMREALRYSPDVFIIHLHGPNERKDERDQLYSNSLHSGLGGLVLESRAVVGLKKLYSEQTGIVIPTHGKKDAPEVVLQPEEEDHDRFDATMDRNLTTMLALARKAGVPVILIGYVENVEGFHSQRGRSFNAVIERHANDTARYFDIGDTLAKLPPAKVKRQFRDRTHLSEKGHQTVGQALTPIVRQLLKKKRRKE